MSLDNLDETLKTLMSEYEKSGMSIDEFIEQKLKNSGRTDAKEVAKVIDSTLTSIDDKFASLQKFKEDGHNREEWLRQEIDAVAKDFTSEQTGQVLSSSIKILNGEASAQPEENANYDALDAVQMIANIDEALIKNTCAALTVEGGK